jgi:hypothetical protein
VQGAQHHRDGLPNQDAFKAWPEDRIGPPLVLAVADGHGSAKSFRSDRGANMAVEAATRILNEFLSSSGGAENLSAVKRTAEERLPGALVQGWKEKVVADLRDRPLSEEELSRVAKNAGSSSRKAVEENNLLAYGSTLQVVGVSRLFVVVLQLGDGVTLFVDPGGEVSEPLPADSRLFGDETTSLCLPNAENDFRVGFYVFPTTPPALILLSTDGYPKSCRDMSGFYQVGSDLLDMMRKEGLRTVSAELKTWLEEVTREGGGDDITLGLLCRLIVPAHAERHPGKDSALSALEPHAP